MAIRPDYMVGTITLTNGSKNFTTAGASLQSANVTGGDTIMTADGRVLIIDKVTGQNAGTLRNNSPISASNVSLVIRFQPDGSKYQGAMRDLLERWGMTGNIDAIAGLETAKDMMAYFTGAGTADTTALTAWARTLLAAANGGKGYEALGRVPDGNLRGSLRSLGQSGVSDADAINENGWWLTATGANNAPVTGQVFYILHMNNTNGAWAYQVAYPFSGGTPTACYSRRKTNNTWGAWELISIPILGNVSQSGGVPTGAIIQRGSNANGKFVRFADGTQVCWFVTATQYTTDTTSSAGVCYSTFPAMTFPVSFSSPPIVSGSSIRSAGFQSWITFLMPSNTSTGSGTLWSAHTAAIARPGYIAIGRWY